MRKILTIILLSLMIQSIYGQSTINASYTRDSVFSKDGTKIAIRKYGAGKGLILLQGAMGTMQNYHQLASLLSDKFTVYVPERRGRGESPKEYTTDHAIERDVEDLKAVIDKFNVEYVFGLSSGAIITLEAARTIPSIKKIAIYEPPLYVKDSVPRAKIQRVFSEISANKYPVALADVFKIVKVGPKAFNFIPRGILKQLTKAFIKSELKKTSTEYAKITDLLPTMRFDFTAVLQRGGNATLFKSIDQPTLLLGGTKSPKYLKQALDFLQVNVKNSQRVVFKKLDHSGPWNKDIGGKPETVAKELINYFNNNQ